VSRSALLTTFDPSSEPYLASSDHPVSIGGTKWMKGFQGPTPRWPKTPRLVALFGLHSQVIESLCEVSPPLQAC